MGLGVLHGFRTWPITALCVLFVIPLGAAVVRAEGAQENAIAVRNAWVESATLDENESAAYMVLENVGGGDDRLVDARTDAAEAVELRTYTAAELGLELIAVDAIPVRQAGIARLEPDGYHLALLGVAELQPDGAPVELILEFEGAGEVVVHADVSSEGSAGSLDGRE